MVQPVAHPSLSTDPSYLPREVLNIVLRPPTSNTQPDYDKQAADVLDHIDTSPVSLPTQEVATTLMRTYFKFSNLSQPLLFEPHFRQRLELLFSMPLTINLQSTHITADVRLSVFIVFEVFAVALLVLQKQNPAKIPTSLASRYHHMAIAALDKTGLPQNIEGVQALLLTSQYCYHHPEMLNVWSIVGAALRLAVEIGLHVDPTPGALSFIDLDIRRRTFWTAYALDRNIGIALGLPTCLADGAISVEVCSASDPVSG